uniref:Uncharacterized protein n=1 Tax=Anguilla anguilla TaxID=7936 RepID=A0A0E9U243_ANGAN
MNAGRDFRLRAQTRKATSANPKTL